MTIQKIGNAWHITDPATDTVTKDTIMARGIQNAIYKHIAFIGTQNPLKTQTVTDEDKALYTKLHDIASL